LTSSSRPENKRKKMDDECLLTITFYWGKTKHFSFHASSELRSWYLSPQSILDIRKDTLTVAYKDGTRIHFPLCNVESYHVAPRNRIDKVEAFKRELLNEPVKEEEDAETPPPVHNG
jgi:hypothetical protein